MMICARCHKKNACRTGDNCTGLDADNIKGLYDEKDVATMKEAAFVEGTYYMQKCRLEEVAIFARDMGMKKLGLAFCTGLAEEAKIIEAYYAKFFQVTSVACKVCGIDKNDFELKHVRENTFEAMCNPKAQAKILNDAQTELNLLVGLCIGHDILFTQNCQAPVTCLVVKDRVLTHNPLGAVYSKYWRNKLEISV